MAQRWQRAAILSANDSLRCGAFLAPPVEYDSGPSALSHREPAMSLHPRHLAPAIPGTSVSLIVGLLFALGAARRCQPRTRASPPCATRPSSIVRSGPTR